MSGLKILMADDHPKEIEGACQALRNMAHQVRIAKTFSEAKRLAEDEVFDIAVIDLGWFLDESFRERRQEAEAADLAFTSGKSRTLGAPTNI